jgi:sortase A
VLIVVLLTLGGGRAFASTYTFEGDTIHLGKSTSVDVIENTSVNNNIKRNKDSAFIPPEFGSRTADTPTTGELLTPNISGVPPMALSSNSTGYAPSIDSHTQDVVVADFTLPEEVMKPDGSIGTLEIEKLGLNVKVYEDESLESLAKGVGHFKITSCYEGLVGLAGHNRGINENFGQIHTLDNGDVLTYSTTLGTRRYSVFSVSQIADNDFSHLARTSDNRLTLITCVKNTPDKRWCVEAREIK